MGMERIKPTRFSASRSCFLPKSLTMPFASSSVAPERPRKSPKMEPNTIRRPMLFIMLPKPAGSVLRTSDAGIPTSRPKIIAAEKRPTDGVTLNLISASRSSANTIKKATNGAISFSFLNVKYFPVFSIQ